MKEKIIYRNIKKEDYSYISDLIVKTFDLDKYINNESLLKIVKQHYLYDCLAEATFVNIAESENKIVGIIMGNSYNDYNFFKHIFFIIQSFFYKLKLKTVYYKHKNEFSSYKNLHIIYENFLSKHKNEFDGVLTLFMVDKNYRRMGIGYQLLNNLLTYLKNNKTKKIYLFTDSCCDYKFYEKQGFDCIEKDILTTLKNNKIFEMDVFLYEYFIKL